MREKLIALIIQDKARIIQLVTGLFVGLLVTGLLKLGITLRPDDAVFITAIAAMVVGWAIEIWTGEANNKGAAKVQEILNTAKGPDIPVDQFIGPGTVARAQQVVTALNVRSDVKG